MISLTMALPETSRLVTFVLLCFVPALFGQGDDPPPVTIIAYKPRGILISTPDILDLNKVDLKVNINKRPFKSDTFDIEALLKHKNGNWMYQDDFTKLKIGDVLRYNIGLHIDGYEYVYAQIQHIVTEIVDKNQQTEPTPTKTPSITTSTKTPIVTTSTQTPIVITSTQIPIPIPVATGVPVQNGKCKPTSTTVLSRGLVKPVCSGQIIFEDDFDILREDLWTLEHYIPSKPEYPFVSYQRPPNGPTVSVENGILRIEPKLQETFPGFDSEAITYSTLNLTVGCTRPGSCVLSSEGAQILPPIASGRITSKTFAFQYGFIEIKAKVPQGDWLYPDILLESVFKKYGQDNYASGVLRITGALGNMILRKGRVHYGNKVLYGGPMMDFKCRTNLLVKKVSTTEWGNDFHIYSLRWAPETITLSVDGEEWGKIEPPASGLQTRLPSDTCEPPRPFLETPMAPFDDYFRIVLGVSAGGISEFPDDLLSLYTIRKPWRNMARRATLNFFNAKDTWFPTWTQPELLVDYVKVRAL